MKRHVQIQYANSIKTITPKQLSAIDVYLTEWTSLYYVKNNYIDENYGVSVTLYIFTVKKETKCYYFLTSGQRIQKNLTGNTYAHSPSKALKKSLNRAQRYLDILISRGGQVAEFIKATDSMCKPYMRDLKHFESIAKQFRDTDDIPLAMLKDNSLNDIERDKLW